MADDTTTSATATARIQKLLQSADAETQEVIRLTLAIERAKLHQANRNKAGVARQIAEEIRRGVQ